MREGGGPRPRCQRAAAGGRKLDPAWFCNSGDPIICNPRPPRSTDRTDSRLDYHTRDIMLARADRSPLALDQTAKRIDGVLVARPLPRLPCPSAITANMVRGLKTLWNPIIDLAGLDDRKVDYRIGCVRIITNVNCRVSCIMDSSSTGPGGTEPSGNTSANYYLSIELVSPDRREFLSLGRANLNLIVWNFCHRVLSIFSNVVKR